MGFLRAQAGQKPTALGTMLQANVYGSLLYLVFGCAKAPPYPIWAANLRKGGSNKKAKKGKGPPTYVENIDMFVGHNPIQGILDIWSNTSNHYPLNFVKVTAAPGFVGGPLASYSGVNLGSDPYFYELVAVTANVSLAGTFSDYGNPIPATAILSAIPSLFPGTGYSIGDRFTINPITSGSILAQCTVTGTGAGGSVTAFTVDVVGSGYAAPAFNIGTTNLSGSGTGLQVSIISVGSTAYSGTYEYPLWNMAQHGPDLVKAGGARWFPFIYYWTPAISPYVYFPSFGSGVGIPNYAGSCNFYYAQRSSVIHRRSPLNFNRFTFENELGNGTEYSDAGLSAQQDIKPDFAGVESSDMDLGSGAIPAWRFEVHGSYTFLPPRDAEFADMIEEFVKCGQKQVGAALGLIHTGCNCNDLPGVVQRALWVELEPEPTAPVVFAQPNAAGSILLAFFRWRTPTGSNASVADAPVVDTWNTIFASANSIFAYATSLGAAAGQVVTGTYNGSGIAYDNRSQIFEMDPGSNTVLNTAVRQGNNAGPAQTLSISIFVPQPAYIMVAGEVQNYDGTKPPPHWDQLSFDAFGSPNFVFKRYVTAPGVYTFTLKSQTGYYNLGMIAMGGQPSPLPAALGNILDDDSFFQTRLQCRAGGLQGSLVTLAQRTAADWLKDLFMASDAWPVWDGFKLYSIPRSEVSAVGQGAVFNAPTASGPTYDLMPSDFVADAKSPMLINERQAQVDADNVDQVQCFDRTNNYDQAMIQEPQTGAIALYGERLADPIVLPMIVDPKVARIIAAIEGRRRTMLRNIRKFKLPPKFLPLRAGSLVTLTDPLINVFKEPYRLTSVVENDAGDFECEAEPFLYGVHAPNIEFIAPTVTNNSPNFVAVPASVNSPVFLEPPTAMTINNALELWIGVSDSDPTYGGCVVNISTDGGASYKTLGIIIGSAVTGILTQDWPPGLDPDFVNDLKVDLTESLGTLASYPVVDENNFVYPFYVEGSTTCGYELGAYSTATLTAPNKYTLLASPNGLRRDVYHQPLAGSVDHPIGKRFMFLGAASQASPKTSATAGTTQAASIFKTPMQTIWKGQTLYFKFQAFNIFGSGLQDLADCTPYTYVPGACAVIPAPDIVTIAVTSPGPGTFTVPHGLLNTPLFAIVQMTSGGEIWLQRPLSVDATNVYLIASAGGLTANVSFFFAPADASVPLAPSAGGAFSVPHGLASTPTLSLVQIDQATGAPVGEIWKGGTPYTSTNLNLVAAAGGITGKDYVWITAPRTPTLTRFASIALAPGGPGNFSVAHGLGVIPKLIIVRMSSGGLIWLQIVGPAISADATNLFLTASAGGITGEAEVWA